MNEHEAQERFARYLVNACPACGAPVGKLCDTEAAWVHAGRFQLVWNAASTLS